MKKVTKLRLHKHKKKLRILRPEIKQPTMKKSYEFKPWSITKQIQIKVTNLSLEYNYNLARLNLLRQV